MLVLHACLITVGAGQAYRPSCALTLTPDTTAPPSPVSPDYNWSAGCTGEIDDDGFCIVVVQVRCCVLVTEKGRCREGRL